MTTFSCLGINNASSLPHIKPECSNIFPMFISVCLASSSHSNVRMDLPIKAKHRTVIKKYPSTRDRFVNGCWRWIEGKRKDDYAEGDFWRVHNKLYDLTNFISSHPGGSFWLEITKVREVDSRLLQGLRKFKLNEKFLCFQGTDITEAFESHHITPKASKLLNDFYVREAVDPRNYFFTYSDSGFYRTLKKRVAEKLKTIDTTVTLKSRFIHDVNLFLLFFAAIMMNRSESNFWFLTWNLIAAQSLAWSTNFSHNFIHQADNWRM